MAVPEVHEYSFSDWSTLTPASVVAPLPWSETSLCVHHAGYMGTRGGVLVVRLGYGAGAQSLCVKPFDKRLVNMDHELLAADILRAAGVRVPAARLASQAEIDEQMTPHLIAKFECTTGSWSIPDFLSRAGLFCARGDLRQKAGIPESVAATQLAALESTRAARRAAIDAGEARAEPVAVLEFVRGPTLVQAGSVAALGDDEYEALGRLAALDVLLNNADRLPVLFETEGNLGNVILEPRTDGRVVCCAIDSCVHPLEGVALERHLARLRSNARDPMLTAAAASLAVLGGADLREAQLDAIRRGWWRGLVQIRQMRRDGALQAALDVRGDEIVAAGGAHGELAQAATYLLATAEAIADVVASVDGAPPTPFAPVAAREDALSDNRLSGTRGLGTFLIETCASLPADAVALFAFDFDKTLTNGFAPPGARLEERIRGGAHTLAGLKATAGLPNALRCIVTARADETGRVSQGKLQQVLSQLSRAQPELLEYFELPSDESCHQIVELVPDPPPSEGPPPMPSAAGASSARLWRWRDVPRSSWGPGMYATLLGDGQPVVLGGALFAAGYSKSLALLRACTAEPASRAPTHVFFIDDAPHNAYEVHCQLPGRLQEWLAHEVARGVRDEPGPVPVVRSLWWDLYEEEFESKTIVPNTSGPDFAYLRDGERRDFLYGQALCHFGLGPLDMAERAQHYERVQKERDERQAAKAAALDISDAAELPAAPQQSVLDRRTR